MFSAIFAWLKDYGILLLDLIKKYGLKTVIILLIIGASLFVVDYIVEYRIKSEVPQAVENSVESSIEKSIETQDAIHMEKLIESQDIYTDVKRQLRYTMKELDCEYIYLVEYHNGSTNIATSFPFRKFDVTMDICKEGVPYIDTTPLKDEHVTKYDIFDNPEFINQQFAYCSVEEFKTIDSKLYYFVQHNKKIKWIYTYNLYYEHKLLGAVLVASYKELNLKTFVNCMHDLEMIFNK